MLSEGIEPSALALGGRSLPHTRAVADGGGIEPLTGSSRHACFRNRLDHLITHHPQIIKHQRVLLASIAFFHGIEFGFLT